MKRVVYEAKETDPNFKIIEGIREALKTDSENRAITTKKAISIIDLDEDGVVQSLENKIAFICKELCCTYKLKDEEIIFEQ